MKKLNYYALYLIVKDIVIGEQSSNQASNDYHDKDKFYIAS